MSEFQESVEIRGEEKAGGMRTFVPQKYRKDVLSNMLNNTYMTGDDIFNYILTDGKGGKLDQTKNGRRYGWLFETICQIVIVLKCVPNMTYDEVLDGQLESLKKMTNIKAVLNCKVEGQGNNKSDMTLKQDTNIVPISMKYRDGFTETDVVILKATLDNNKTPDWKIGLFVMDKYVYLNHTYKDDKNPNKIELDKIHANGLMFDETDIVKALSVFCERFSNNQLEIDDFMEFINSDYLLCPRIQLTKKFHQNMTLMKFIQSLTDDQFNTWCIAHKMRSGKSITILLLCKHLLEQGSYKRILIMTAVPATINSFIQDLDKFIDFRTIKYMCQDEFDTVDELYQGIVFSSVQYLKNDKTGKKKELLKQSNFDVIIADESHQGSSTDKTRCEILDVDNELVSEVSKNAKLKIFASGTSNKTQKYYKIPYSHVYMWDTIDVSYMKQIDVLCGSAERDDLIDIMRKRHGHAFVKCLENKTLNCDYSRDPIQVLMKWKIDESLKDDIKKFNNDNNHQYGYNCASLFALSKIKNEKGDYVYTDKFELSNTNDGEEILKHFLDSIISSNRMRKNTVMKQIELTQSSQKSRISTKENPLLFIVYLPTHTGNSNISMLQKTLKQFLETHNMWKDYNIEYSNAKSDTGDFKEEYNDSVITMMDRTKKNNKKGCILLLGNKGTVGITYTQCDVTISLDEGHNLDHQKQKFSRALTEATGKTIGINVDMNIQRTYLFMNDLVHQHRQSSGTKKNNAEILYYLYEQNIFLFDPHEFNNGIAKTVDIKSYYDTESTNMLAELDDTRILEDIVCDDDMRSFLKADFSRKNQVSNINPDLEGEQQDCPKGDKSKIYIDAPTDKKQDNDTDDTNENNSLEDTIEHEILINQTFELCKNFLFPLLALISRTYGIHCFKQIFTNIKTKNMMVRILFDKKIDLNVNSYIQLTQVMNIIIDNNSEIVNNLREIYSMAPPDTKLRQLIEKHFVPTASEKRDNAEIPTPVVLVDDMLNSLPVECWRSPFKVFEPCCGKGNFVLGIFDKFYNGLAEIYPDEIERCCIILTECIYYADLTPLNVFITTEILKCHVQSKCGMDECDYSFNTYTGDTLKFDFRSHWNINSFDNVIGNPPYNAWGATSTGNTIWQDFTKKALNDWLCSGGKLLFVHPPGWRKPNTDRGKFTKMFDLMTKENTMKYLEIHGTADGQKVFNCGTRYDWYLVEKTPSPPNTNTVVKDENGECSEIDLTLMNWLSNSNILEINSLLAKPTEERCPIIQSMSAYEPRKKHMSSIESLEFKYKCVHTTPKTGVRYMYSNVNTKGHFGVSKVIFGDSGIYNPIIDMDGDYGMTQHSMAIQVDNLEEATNICKAIESDKFGKILQSCLYSSYAIDWNIFKDFKRNFWKEFI